MDPGTRYVLLDMIEEYARHDGHADLIRESVDGLIGHDPPARRSPAWSARDTGRATMTIPSRPSVRCEQESAQ
jgi:uncharacterized protein DUF664